MTSLRIDHWLPRYCCLHHLTEGVRVCREVWLSLMEIRTASICGCKKLKERLLFHEFEKMTKCGYHQVGSYFIQHIPYASYYSTRPFA